VADLLDLSRLNAGSFSVVPEVNAVEDLFGAALQRVSGRCASAACTWTSTRASRCSWAGSTSCIRCESS
jgi:K+-sensing histidine kinase KdpD